MSVFKSTFLVLGSWLALIAICVCPAPARADTVFPLTGTFVDNSTVSGTLTIDVTTGMVDAASLSYLGSTYSTILLTPPQGPFSGATNPGQAPLPVAYAVDIGTSSAALPRIDLLIPGTSAVDSLVSYVGGPLCSLDAQCGPDQAGNMWVGAFHSSSGAVVALEFGAVPAPIAGAGLPGLIAACGGLLAWWRRKRKAQAVV